MHVIFLLLTAAHPVVEIELYTNGRYIDRASFGKARVLQDGGFLLNNFHHVWHWDDEGNVINMFGGRGEGPGEFVSISEVRFDGDHYWTIDGSRMLSSVFDRDGRYLFRKASSYRQFISVGERLFIVDSSQYNQLMGVQYPPVLQEIEYKITEQDLMVGATGERFKKISERQQSLSWNFKLLWLVEEDDGFLIVDQLEPIIRVYDANALRSERATDDEQAFEPDSIAMRLLHWSDAPEQMINDLRSNDKMLRWWYSWSRINHFGISGEDFFVAYESPNPDDERQAIQVIQRIGRDGQRKGEPLIVDGMCMGVLNDQVYIFHDEESMDRFSYSVRIYDF